MPHALWQCMSANQPEQAHPDLKWVKPIWHDDKLDIQFWALDMTGFGWPQIHMEPNQREISCTNSRVHV
jgi:hypothetical protein